MDAMRAFLSLCRSGDALNIGGARTAEVGLMQEAGLTVHCCDYAVTGIKYESTPVRPSQYDGVYCSHTLEHVRNVGAFLDRIVTETKPGGIIAIVVPPRKDEIVGGHLTLWNAGLLVYNIIRAGVDCSSAYVGSYGYNVACVVRNIRAELPPLAEDAGDIEALAPFFPAPVAQGFDGRTFAANWPTGPKGTPDRCACGSRGSRNSPLFENLKVRSRVAT